MSDNRPARYIEVAADGTETVVYRASSLGGCLRAMVAAARGIKPTPHPQWFQEVLDEGTRMEEQIDKLWSRQSHHETVDTQPEIELEIGTIEGRRVIVRGHMDGISDQGHLREYKKFRPSTWPDFKLRGVEINNYYPWQVSVYMHATGKPCEFVGGEYVPEAVMGGDSTQAQIIVPEHIASVHAVYLYDAPIPLTAIKQRVAKVERLVNEGYGPDEVECIGSYPCGFWFLHDKGPDKPEVEMDGWWRDHLAQWDQVNIAIKDAKKKVESLEAAKTSLGNAIKERMVALGVAEGGSVRVVDGTIGVTVTRVKTKVAERVQTIKGYDLDYVKVTWPRKTKQERETDQ